MRPLFIGGCERSGTTMLGAMLGCHSRCLCVPESQFLDDLLAHADLEGRIDPRVTLARISSNARFRLLWGLDLEQGTTSPTEVGTTYPEVVAWLVQAYGHKAGRPGPTVWIDHTPTNFRRARTLLRMFP